MSRELEQIKNYKTEIKKVIESKDKLINEMNLKIISFNQEFIKLQNMIKNWKIINNKNLGKEESNSFKSSLNDLENISLGNNFNIDIRSYEYAKKMKKNKSEKNIKAKNKVANLNFDSKVGTYNFNDEFLKDYQNFSESWRKEVDKMLERRGNNNKIPVNKLNTFDNINKK